MAKAVNGPVNIIALFVGLAGSISHNTIFQELYCTQYNTEDDEEIPEILTPMQSKRMTILSLKVQKELENKGNGRAYCCF